MPDPMVNATASPNISAAATASMSNEPKRRAFDWPCLLGVKSVGQKIIAKISASLQLKSVSKTTDAVWLYVLFKSENVIRP